VSGAGRDALPVELSTRPEILRLSRLLGVPPQRLDYLAGVDPAELRVFRRQVADTLFDADLTVLRRMAAASRLLPAGVLARIAENVFGPLLCARIAGLVEPARAVDVAKRLSSGFLADVAVELDPRRTGEIIARIPDDTAVEIAGELARRADWLTIGNFVGHLPDETVRRCLGVVDDVALLQVAFLLEDRSRAARVVELLPAARRRGLLRTAAAHDLWPAAFGVLVQLAPDRRREFADTLAALDQSVRAEAAERAGELGLLDRLRSLGFGLG
jgi:hypothetical protein